MNKIKPLTRYNHLINSIVYRNFISKFNSKHSVGWPIATAGYQRHIFRPPFLVKMPFKRMTAFFFVKKYPFVVNFCIFPNLKFSDFFSQLFTIKVQKKKDGYIWYGIYSRCVTLADFEKNNNFFSKNPNFFSYWNKKKFRHCLQNCIPRIQMKSMFFWKKFFRKYFRALSKIRISDFRLKYFGIEVKTVFSMSRESFSGILSGKFRNFTIIFALRAISFGLLAKKFPAGLSKLHSLVSR